MNKADKVYIDCLSDIMRRGVVKTDRTGVGTKSVFSRELRFGFEEGFPLITTKKVHWKSIVHELIWFIKGETNIKYLTDNGVTIWNEWADADGELGPVYGYQWRHWGKEGIDQLQECINKLKNKPDDRRIIVSAWNVAEIPQMKLPPCHLLYQFLTEPLTEQERIKEYCRSLNKSSFFGEKLTTEDLDKLGAPKFRLHLKLFQRSCDMFLGVPFNIASYALLQMMVANEVNMALGEFVWSGTDCHIYTNHYEQVSTQVQRIPKKLPTVKLNVPVGTSIFDIKYEDIVLENYDPHPAIKADVAI